MCPSTPDTTPNFSTAVPAAEFIKGDAGLTLRVTPQTPEAETIVGALNLVGTQLVSRADRSNNPESIEKAADTVRELRDVSHNLRQRPSDQWEKSQQVVLNPSQARLAVRGLALAHRVRSDDNKIGVLQDSYQRAITPTPAPEPERPPVKYIG